ncbi:hypothetical protein NOX90_03275 [Wolbachia endosymbiont of Anurida maritima]|uniref:hypothetical protein n=1 Tax=Wolbachia endosymbiont of Anurida maritima TaxID=2850562 RepID=UPI0035CF64DE
MQLETKEKKIEELEDKSEKTGKLLGEKVTEILGLKSEIENLRVKIGEITKEKENLSGELHNEKVYINELLDGLDRIQKGCDSKVKKLQDLLFDESSNRELLEKGLLEEKKSVAQQIIEYMTNKVNEVEELTKKMKRWEILKEEQYYLQPDLSNIRY